ncbi:hypothetical protein LTR74_018545 [Friedmanniomyces endolithicus]|nr:hypothetical protein LTR74_018545 [Friedmanniomyces endolithicus]
MTTSSQTQTFRLEPMTLIDFAEILAPRNRRGGDLCTAPLELCWPDSGSDDEVYRRLEYSTRQQKKFFTTDPTSHFVKVVTPDGSEIACIGRWNYFPHGYDFVTHHVVSVTEFVPDGARAPEGLFRLELYRDIVEKMMGQRREWMPKGPVWGESLSCSGPLYFYGD